LISHSWFNTFRSRWVCHTNRARYCERWTPHVHCSGGCERALTKRLETCSGC